MKAGCQYAVGRVKRAPVGPVRASRREHERRLATSLASADIRRAG